MLYILYFILFYGLLIIVSSIDFNNGNADYMILFGSGLKQNKETFTMIKRVNRASLYLLRNPDCKVICTGGITGNNTISEAEIMSKLLKDRHIEDKRMILENKATDTLENIKYSLDLIEKDKKIVLCSSDYHILRCKLLALRHGVKTHSIFSQSNIIELLIHILLEEVFIIYDLIRF